LWDNDKQLELPTHHNVAGLRTIVWIIGQAIETTSASSGDSMAKLQPLVEFLLPLLEDYLSTT
jgi:hypothetical protein